MFFCCEHLVVGCYHGEFGCDLCHFDAEQAFAQSKLDKVVFIWLPPGCGELSGKVVKLGRSLYGLRQSSRTWHIHLMRGLKCLGFESCAADACVMRLVEHNLVVVIVVVHVDDIFSIGLKSRCGKFGVDLNRPLCTHHEPLATTLVRRLPVFP